MYKLLNEQFIIFLYLILLGVFLGFIYDIFRISRVIINTKTIIIFFQDIIYFILCACITFGFILIFNNGEFRFYIIMSECIGWSVYYLTFGEFIYKITKIVNKNIKYKSKRKNMTNSQKNKSDV